MVTRYNNIVAVDMHMAVTMDDELYVAVTDGIVIFSYRKLILHKKLNIY